MIVIAAVIKLTNAAAAETSFAAFILPWSFVLPRFFGQGIHGIRQPFQSRIEELHGHKGAAADEDRDPFP